MRDADSVALRLVAGHDGYPFTLLTQHANVTWITEEHVH